MTPDKLSSCKIDILNNSIESPVLRYFHRLLPLARLDGETPVQITAPNSNRQVSLKSFAYEFYLDQYKPPMRSLALGIYNPQDQPIGFFDTLIGEDNIPRFYISGMQFLQDSQGTPFLNQLAGYIRDSKRDVAIYLDQKYRHLGLGQTIFAIMTALLQNSGYASFMVVKDATRRHQHWSIQFPYDNNLIKPNLSFYGRYTRPIDPNSDQYYGHYLTALSTVQIDLLRQATRPVQIPTQPTSSKRL